MFRSSFYRTQREKLGNILIYVSDYLRTIGEPQPGLTKILKLLYLIDENSVRKNGVPITWLDYYAWRRGPVASDVYFEVKRLEKKVIADEELSLDHYITAVTCEHKKGSEFTCIAGKKTFEKKLFSKYEMMVIDEVLKKYGKWTAKRLENETHKTGTLYDKAVKGNKLEKVFQIKANSKVILEFIHLIEKEPIKLLAYKSAYEALAFEEELVS